MSHPGSKCSWIPKGFSVTATEVGFHPQAREEYFDALACYIAKSETLGRAFQAEVKEAVARLVQNPQSRPVYEDDIRWIRTHRFPYIVYYECIEEHLVVVLAVAHAHRRPGYWRHRRNVN